MVMGIAASTTRRIALEGMVGRNVLVDEDAVELDGRGVEIYRGDQKASNSMTKAGIE
jgi:hypothetical protein